MRQILAWPCVAACGVVALAGPARAAPARADDSGLCLLAAQDAERLSGVPLDVLLGITLTETGRQGRPWPWTVNLEGEGHWFATRQEATAFAEAALAGGHDSFDVGCFQVNWRWHHENFVSVAQMFDPLANASYAAGFLKDLEAESGDWSVAAGAYHSRTPDEAARYRVAFDANRARADDAPLAEPPAEGIALASASDTAPRQNAYRLLQRQSVGGRMGSLVPLGG